MLHTAVIRAQGFSLWLVLLVDLRCHGESTQIAQRSARPHSMESTAEDELTLLGELIMCL